MDLDVLLKELKSDYFWQYLVSSDSILTSNIRFYLCVFLEYIVVANRPVELPLLTLTLKGPQASHWERISSFEF